MYMKYGIIITNQEVGHNAYKIKRYLEEQGALGISLCHVVNDGTIASINDSGDVVINLPKCDFIIYCDKDIYLARLLEKAGYLLFNSADFTKLCDDKILTFIKCANMGISMPKTFAGPLFYNHDLNDENTKFLSQVGKEIGFPLVMKRVYGSLGEGVFLVNNQEELVNLYKKLSGEPVLFQKYIASSYGKSMRVIVIDGKVFGAFERYNPEDFRSNFSVHASSRATSNPKFLAFAQHIADKLNILYAGIDLLYGENDTPILCEINSNAFFEEFEKITSLNVAKAYLEMVLNHLK